MSPEQYQPQLVEETETLLGTPYFTHESGYEINDYTAEELGLRQFIYGAGCRILARARNEDRLTAPRTGEDVREWNDSWEPTTRKIAEIAFQYETDVTPLARQLALVNNATTYMNEHWEELSERLHPDQQMYMMDIMPSLQKAPRCIEFTDELGETESYAIQGMTIIAPTGFGKTRLMETCIKMFEPGQPLRNCRSAEPTRIVVVSPSLILLGFEATELRAKKMLRAAGHTWYGRLEGDEGNRRLVHYYSPEARDYLHQVLPKGVHLDIEETANVLHIPVAAVRQVINDPANNITGGPVSRGEPGRPPICYSEEERTIIGRLAKKIPGANKGDRRLTEIAQEFGVSPETALKWAGADNKDRLRLGGAFYLTAKEIEIATIERDKVPSAAEEEMNLMRIAEQAGVNHQVVARNITPADWAAAREKRYKDPRGYTRMTHIWPADKSKEIIQRMQKFKPRPLEAHLLPSRALRKIIRNYGVTPSPEITAMLADGGFEVEEQLVTDTRGMSRCLTWQAIEYLEGILGKNISKTAISIDYSRLPSGPNDTDPDKIAYARSIQLLFLQPGQLKNYDDN
jgi:hypothetical protein